jgi:hypothetical protein
MSSLFVANVEKLEETNVIGVYSTEKLCKDAIMSYVENCDDITFKRKQIKKESDDVRKVLFLQDIKVAPMAITINKVNFDFSKVKLKKEKKDTPNKSLSAFIIFNKENREKIKAANPDVTFGELGKLIGNAWKSLDQKQRLIYQQKSEVDKERYTTEMDKYTELQKET